VEKEKNLERLAESDYAGLSRSVVKSRPLRRANHFTTVGAPTLSKM
jgi:hypothetical protein